MADQNVTDTSRELLGDSFERLEALVRAELAALERPAARRRRDARPVQQGQRRQSLEGNNVIVGSHWAHEEDAPFDLDYACCSDEDGPLDAAVMLDAGEDDPPNLSFDQQGESSEDHVFTLEERTFIERAVKWLEPRKNKDLVVSRIWALLTDSDPEDFFQPNDEQQPRTEPESKLEPPSEAAPQAQGQPMDSAERQCKGATAGESSEVERPPSQLDDGDQCRP
jgi:hypothetical protein